MLKLKAQKLRLNNSSTPKLGQKQILSFLLISLFSIFFLFLLTSKNYLYLVRDFIFTPQNKISSFEERVNILILGKAGKGHTAPELTDSIILASISLKKPSIVIISLPRDIWIPEIRAKLNSAYYWGRPKDEGGGLILAKSFVEKIVAKPVPYGVVFDFSAFTKIIDVLGGIEVEVERSFFDEKYPLPGKENDLCNGDKEFKCRYETIHFIQGKQLMDGETALKFVRSRNAEGEEGSDLAREARQQKVIVAVKKKVLSFSTIFSPKRIWGVWQILSSSIETDMDLSGGAILLRRIFDSRNVIKNMVLSEDLLIHPPISSLYDNQYVFIPKAGDWSQVQSWVTEILK